MPYPDKKLEPEAGLLEWFGAELRHHRKRNHLTQTELGQRVYTSGSKIGKIEKAERGCTAELAASLDQALQTGGVLTRAWRLVEAQADKQALEADDPLNRGSSACETPVARDMLGHAEVQPSEEPPVKRREFLATAATWSTLLATETTRIPGLADLITAVLNSAPDRSDDLPALSELQAEVSAAKREYQSCRYREVLQRLPDLLQNLHRAEDDLGEDATMLRADAYQIVSGVMLKHSEQSLATLAADRSMSAATAAGSPITIASSARAVTHVLMRTGYPDFAADFASNHARKLEPEPPTPDTLSVSGALLLRGAVAAADAGKRAMATELLDAADDAGGRLEHNGNVRGTGFNPVNVAVHHVHIALVLGDAGRAIELARRIDMDQILLVERRVSLAIDVATAFAQWGRYDRALDTLYFAETAAPQEVRVRRNVAELVSTIEGAAPISIRPHATAFARKLATA